MGVLVHRGCRQLPVSTGASPSIAVSALSLEDAEMDADVAFFAEPELDLFEAIGHAFRTHRRLEGLSQRRLAVLLGWDRAKVGRWEAGDLPIVLAQVDGLLRGMGFHLVLTPTPALAARLAAEGGSTMEHVRDRGLRRFPAHLQIAPEQPMTTSKWCRHRGEPSPFAGYFEFRRTLAKDHPIDEPFRY